MSVSPYFRHISSPREQGLIDSLTRETIFQRGLDLYYIPRTNSEKGFDYLFGEDPNNFFDSAVIIEMYIENVSTGFDGSTAVGRFMLELNDVATFLVSRTRFTEEITSIYKDIVRPREGDLIVVPFDDEEPMYMFEITFVERTTPFYQLGKTNIWRMEAERFNFSHEDMKTNVSDIDDIDLSEVNEISDSQEIQKESDTFVDFNEQDPFSDGKY